MTNRTDPPKAWWCVKCGRATVTMYRCSNWDCAADLAGESLEAVE